MGGAAQVALIVAVLAMGVFYYGPENVQRRLNDVWEPVSSGECRAKDYLTTVKPIQGFHVLCVTLDTTTKQLKVQGYLNGQDNTVSYTSDASMDAFRRESEEHLKIKLPTTELERKYKQPWRLFTPEGDVIASMNGILQSTTVFVFEGGQFIWPGVKIGHKFQIRNINGWGDVQAETLSLTPLVFRINEFISDEECELIKELSTPHLKSSGVALMDKDKGKPATEWRTSATYFLPSNADKRLHIIDKRVEQLTKVPESHQEDAQVLRYELTQKYDAHHDYFSPHLYSQSPQVLESIHHGFKNRMITVFWYMSDVAKGGHTIFPRAGGHPPPTSYKDCSTGLKVTPKKRMVIIFYSLLPDGTPDEYSLHGGCPVEEGVKFAVNKWVWNKTRK